MNLLSIGAALGVMTAAFQFGWGKSLLGFTKAGPIEVFLPVLMFAILFGLSMDYEVFLVSRMHEEWVRTGDARRSVTVGQAETGRVITAAALIMILVFAVIYLRRPARHQGVRPRFRGRHLRRRLCHPDHPGAVGDAPPRTGELVVAGLARPHPADRARRARRHRPPPDPPRGHTCGTLVTRTSPPLVSVMTSLVARIMGPPPTNINGRRVVVPDVVRTDATLRFDVAAKEATGEATVYFSAGELAGCAVLDLRQPVDWVRLDGQDLDPQAFAPLDLGAGPGEEMRLLDVNLEAATSHRLDVGYRLETPQAVGAEPIAWTDGGVRFDLWMSDLQPGRYLEMWIPAPLVHDQFVLNVDVQLTGSPRPHTLVANTAGVDAAAGRRAVVAVLPGPLHLPVADARDRPE